MNAITQKRLLAVSLPPMCVVVDSLRDGQPLQWCVAPQNRYVGSVVLCVRVHWNHGGIGYVAWDYMK